MAHESTSGRFGSIAHDREAVQQGIADVEDFLDYLWLD
jgi:hypothetical protein